MSALGIDRDASPGSIGAEIAAKEIGLRRLALTRRRAAATLSRLAGEEGAPFSRLRSPVGEGGPKGRTKDCAAIGDRGSSPAPLILTFSPQARRRDGRAKNRRRMQRRLSIPDRSLRDRRE
jgi:hypothetical protein